MSAAARRWLRACVLPWVARAACGGSAELRPLRVGDPAPPYSARPLGGGSFVLAEERGRVVLLNVWATWCVPCRTEMPALEAVHGKFGHRGLRVIGVNIDAGSADSDVRGFLEDYGITFDNVRDPEDRVTRVFRLMGVPETLLIDAEGRVSRRWLGPVSQPEVERRVQELLENSAR